MNRTETDYYSVLNIPRSATAEDIKLAYRSLAIKLNPCRDPQHERDFVPLADENISTHMVPLSNTRQWEYINMAYDVLGNDLYRSIYDRYGEGGLFEGVLLPNGYFPPYQYHGDHMQVYYSVFSTMSPYANLIDAITKPPVLYTSREFGIGIRQKEPPVEKVINLELEEVRNGCTKLMHVWRMELDQNNENPQKKKKTLTLKISPGTTAGTRFTFIEEGDQHPTTTPADIVFITSDKPHPVFKRTNAHDIVYTHTISLCEALIGFRLTIDTLDKRKLTISITDVVKPGYQKIIPGEGLPKCIPGEQKMLHKRIARQFGDLILNFNIIFPDYLTQEMKVRTLNYFKCLNESN